MTLDILPSVWYGDDSSLLARIIPFYSRIEPKPIVDVTAGGRRFWKSGLKAICLDIQASLKPDAVADFCNLPIKSESVAVLVWDPPHLADCHGSSVMKERYGLDLVKGSSIEYWFPMFLPEAKRVLKPDGILLVKLTDGIHGGTYQWISHHFVSACYEHSLWPCDN